MKKLKTCLFVILLLTLFSLCACSKKSDTQEQWQKQYDLGVRYLSEGNYEEAIIAFMAAIEIDPKRVETYVALADTYDTLGDIEQLISILEQGAEATGDEKLKERLNDLMIESDSTEEAEEDQTVNEADQEEFNVEDVVLFENILTIEDIPLANMSFEEAAAKVGADHFFEFEDEEEASVDNGVANIINVYRKIGESEVNRFSYVGWFEDNLNIEINTEIRGIQTGDSFETVLVKIGIEPDMAGLISNSAKNIAYTSDSGQGDGIAYLYPEEDTYSAREGLSTEDYRQISVCFMDYRDLDEGPIAYLTFMFYKDRLTDCYFDRFR